MAASPRLPRGRPTRAVIDLAAIAANFRALQKRAGSAQVFAVVKADAYGHGAAAVARRLESEGANRFAVAIAEEGVELRRAGIRSPILILGFSDPADAPLHRAFGLIPSLNDLGQARAFEEATRSFVPPLPVHVKIDTGMGRLGILPDDLAPLAEILRRARGLLLAGTFTQLARAEESDPSATARPIEIFESVVAALREAWLDPGLLHVANSSALLAHSASIFQAVRPGIALFGIPPAQSLNVPDLSPAMTLETAVMSAKPFAQGARVGYGGLFVTRRASIIAALPIGYYDGVRRSLSGRASVLLRGEKAPIVGAVNMDLTLVDATGTGAARGDCVVLLGSDGRNRIGAWDLARAAETVPYEIVCGIGSRVPRVYV